MTPVALSETIAVGEVPTRDQIAILAKAGFRSLLNTQPDGEVARHLTSAQCRDEAHKQGLVYQHQPIESRRPLDDAIEGFAAAVAGMPKPIYACCYSGSRTAAAWALAAAARQEPGSIISACAEAGYDIAFMRDDHAARQAAANAAAKPVTAQSTVAVNGHAVNGAATAVPALVPSIVLPRAASAGGFAVSG